MPAVELVSCEGNPFVLFEQTIRCFSSDFCDMAEEILDNRKITVQHGLLHAIGGKIYFDETRSNLSLMLGYAHEFSKGRGLVWVRANKEQLNLLDHLGKTYNLQRMREYVLVVRNEVEKEKRLNPGENSGMHGEKGSRGGAPAKKQKKQKYPDFHPLQINLNSADNNPKRLTRIEQSNTAIEADTYPDFTSTLSLPLIDLDSPNVVKCDQIVSLMSAAGYAFPTPGSVDSLSLLHFASNEAKVYNELYDRLIPMPNKPKSTLQRLREISRPRNGNYYHDHHRDPGPVAHLEVMQNKISSSIYDMQGMYAALVPPVEPPPNPEVWKEMVRTEWNYGKLSTDEREKIDRENSMAGV